VVVDVLGHLGGHQGVEVIVGVREPPRKIRSEALDWWIAKVLWEFVAGRRDETTPMQGLRHGAVTGTDIENVCTRQIGHSLDEPGHKGLMDARDGDGDNVLILVGAGCARMLQRRHVHSAMVVAAEGDLREGARQRSKQRLPGAEEPLDAVRQSR
jgi:hypothetical protein